ncbi:hypothetical protein [Hymenobacter sp. BT491]|uniref:hypothetical protein n=1 Tax=Hymenobacter sp. BT491 TaxID=2766779 RepID=UPI00165397F7|nr:hypothetical protein [Hymenobacter sp. BT491]MBC6991820.1 hypothetical protein [Hymenobacter sp. BT491]
MAIDPNNRPVRVINDDTTSEEFQAGHIIPGASPPTNEDARGGFGNRDGKQGYGTDSSDGISAVSVNEDADKSEHPADNMRTADEGADQRPNQDLPADDDIDARRVAPIIDELEADDLRPTDEMSDPDSRVGMGQMEQPQPNATDVGATPETNADLLDRNAQESGIEL